MKIYLLQGALVLALLLMAKPGKAQDFVYEPKNPAFGGGNTFNYAWLLSSAQAQNDITDPTAAARSSLQLDPLKQFEQSLNQQILSQLAQKLVGNRLGGAGSTPTLQEGTYSVGGYQISITPAGGGGFSVLILDSNSGNQTTITIPAL
jgi:curli production assembly/transport component CsgF